jgi:nucleoside diphosphate kinase
MIKPDAMAAGHKQGILAKIKENGFTVVAEKELQLTKEKAKEFYKEHDGKPFYDGLTDFMSSYVLAC